MEQFEIEGYSDYQQSLGTSGRVSLCHTNQNLKLHEKFKKERHSFTYGEVHDSPYRTSRNHQKDEISGKITKKDEIVRYMSNLPCYLERGEHLQEKVLSVGVLDWGRLEKWQHGHKQLSSRSSWNPTVRSNGSSSSSSDSLSPHFGKDHISRQRLHRPSLYSHLLASPHSQFVKSFGESEKCQDLKFVHSNTLKGQGKSIKSNQQSCKTDREVKIKQTERTGLETEVLRECKTLPDVLNYEVASSRRGELLGVDKSRAQKDFADEHDVLEKPEAIVLLPSSLVTMNDTQVPERSDSTLLLNLWSNEAGQQSSMKRSAASFSPELNCNIPNSSKTPCEVNGNQFPLKHNCSTNASSNSRSVSRLARAGYSPCKARISEAETSVVAPLNSRVKEASIGLNLKASTVSVDKARSPSPFSRLSISMGRRRKSSSSMGNSCASVQGSTHIPVQSGSENAMPSACVNELRNDRPNNTSRASSSPLRRLLDPLLKPKAVVYHHAVEPIEKDLHDTPDKIYDRQSNSSTLQSRKLMLDMSRCRKISVSDTALDKKQGSSVVHALLQVAFKNGLPLFTFAVDNVSNILAATVKLTSSRKGAVSHIYTFFIVQEVKRKTGSWINQGSKGKGCDYVSNVIAQMNVSDSEISQVIRPYEPSTTREFVLFSVDLKQADRQTSDFLPNEELAAIIVKIPPKIKQGSRECSPLSKGSEQVQRPGGGESFISTTVLLPSGIHSLPSKGGPSSLIERWTSGGSCDCGGWDLGCKLRVFANQNQKIEKSSSSQSFPITNQFKLFPQEGVPENDCILSLAAFKDMIYSIEFDSSLSLLQAFSICLAMIDGKNSCELSESSILFEAKTPGESKLMHNDRLWTPNLAEREDPAEHVACPPLSPFGRV
ncbi:uncharacterized protein LOC120088364 [Benincasa hispida]|uniref:uncharacterized protein LOC120088364 n=1 Tax=Benincasa hispida TaxID=102211 RepID=UPI0019012D1A|nr:uncharacterized protein LOC120088364 [Benincasa hispida]XP_038901520.1 uncharacterized protein LOC120088364 [Benincasa hispida]XP_038901522.1 uncharacterized protein LOC120088364 [Benincasa hispida]XP_038901523.1 uncharacterized protein LOC120088364 [Benincasa hispida]